MRALLTVPSARTQATVWPFFRVPLNTRSSARRPRKGLESRLVTHACRGASSSYSGAGTCWRMASNSGSRSSLSGSAPLAGRLRDAAPARPLAYTTGTSRRASTSRSGTSSTRSDASPSSRSWASSSTSAMRASGRSVLLTSRMTGSFASSALRSTKRVCGSGPSLASTSSTTPSTIERPRSTSPPKSAWPGVSMTLIVTGTSVWRPL